MKETKEDTLVGNALLMFFVGCVMLAIYLETGNNDLRVMGLLCLLISSVVLFRYIFVL